MKSFKSIRARAEKRKGGAAALAALLPTPPDNSRVAAVTDDRVLAEMARRVFCAGFVWCVIEQKWPGFEAAIAAWFSDIGDRSEGLGSPSSVRTL